jgi:hypothetical protein
VNHQDAPAPTVHQPVERLAFTFPAKQRSS